jgi:hypothetical protein
MATIRRIFSSLNIIGRRKKQKQAEDASIYPLF